MLTDCSNIFSSLAAYQPRVTDKATKILIYYLRDNMTRVAFTFIDAGWNIADIGTKEKTQKEKWWQLLENNTFEIGFIGRKAYKAIQ